MKIIDINKEYIERVKLYNAYFENVEQVLFYIDHANVESKQEATQELINVFNTVCFFKSGFKDTNAKKTFADVFNSYNFLVEGIKDQIKMVNNPQIGNGVIYEELVNEYVLARTCLSAIENDLDKGINSIYLTDREKQDMISFKGSRNQISKQILDNYDLSIGAVASNKTDSCKAYCKPLNKRIEELNNLRSK